MRWDFVSLTNALYRDLTASIYFSIHVHKTVKITLICHSFFTFLVNKNFLVKHLWEESFDLEKIDREMFLLCIL